MRLAYLPGTFPRAGAVGYVVGWVGIAENHIGELAPCCRVRVNLSTMRAPRVLKALPMRRRRW